MELVLQQWEREQVKWEMGEGKRILAEEIAFQRANEFWEERRMDIWKVSIALGLEELHNEMEDDSEFREFMFDLCHEGAHEPCVREIAQELKEFLILQFGVQTVRAHLNRDLTEIVNYMYKR